MIHTQNMSKTDMTAENCMIIEDYKALNRDLMKGKTHGIDCFCPSDLYWPWKSLPVNKHRKPRKHHLFFAWLLLHTQQSKERNDKTVFKNNYKYVKKLLAQIDKEKFKKLIEGYNNVIEVYRIALRNIKILDEMIEIKLAALESLFGEKEKIKSPKYETNKEAIEQMKIVIMNEMWSRKINKYFKKEKNILKDSFLTVRILTFVFEEKEISQRKLLKRFSDKRLKDLVRCSIILIYMKLIKWDPKNNIIYYTGPTNLNSGTLKFLFPKIKKFYFNISKKKQFIPFTLV